MGMYTEEGLKKPDGFMGLRSGLYRLVTITCIQGKDSNLKENHLGYSNMIRDYRESTVNLVTVQIKCFTVLLVWWGVITIKGSQLCGPPSCIWQPTGCHVLPLSHIHVAQRSFWN